MISPAVAEAQEALRQLLLQHPNTDTVWVGFSGGLDSTALLWLASQTLYDVLPKAKLRALHVNHNLQPDAANWAEHCRSIAGLLNVESVVRSVQPRTSSEEDARNARYTAMSECLAEGELLLLGHHLNDQAETLLMRLFRGSGVQGLAAMRRTRAFGRGWIVRPLLGLTRGELEALVVQQGLTWIEDPSNQKSSYLRNWIRNQLSGVLAQRWPDWSEKLSTTAASIDEAAQLNEALATIDAGGEFVNPQPVTPSVLTQPLRLKNLLFYWLRSQQVFVGSRVQLESFAAQLSTANSGSCVIGELEVHWYQHQLWISPVSLAQQSALELELSATEHPLGCGVLLATKAARGLPVGLKVLVRTRAEGDQVKLAGGTQSVKKFMNARKIPPWLRDSWPLIEVDGEIISVVGVWSADAWLVDDGLVLNWHC